MRLSAFPDFEKFLGNDGKIYFWRGANDSTKISKGSAGFKHCGFLALLLRVVLDCFRVHRKSGAPVFCNFLAISDY